MLASVALTCSLCPPCPHSFGRDPDFESWLGNLHLKLWLLPLSLHVFYPPFGISAVLALPLALICLSIPSFFLDPASHLCHHSLSFFPSLWEHFLTLLSECHLLLNPNLLLSGITRGVWGSCFSALTLFRTVCIWRPAAISGMSPQVASGHLLFWLHACCCSSSFSALPPLLPLKYLNSQSCRMVLGDMSPQLPMGHLCTSSSHPLWPER